MMNKYTEEYALYLDAEDPLRAYRQEFLIPDPDMIYLDGNSLGRLPKGSVKVLEDAANFQWGERLIRSWNENWYNKNTELGDKIATLAGAGRGEVVISDSTSVNLYKLAHSVIKMQKGRKKIITDDLNFPSDIYVMQGLVNELGSDYELVVLRSVDGSSMNFEDIINALDQNTALLTLSHVAFKSSFMYPMKELTRYAHSKGTLVLWDLSHSIGSVPVNLEDANADLAVGCTYKYLNGGPGSPAFVYVRNELQDKLQSPVWGWFGDDQPFDFRIDYRAAGGIRKFLAGTPPVLSMMPLETSLDMFIDAGMDRIREKSIRQTSFLIDLADKYLVSLGFRVGSPRDPGCRGSHVSLQHNEAFRISKAMINPGIGERVIIPDFREPDNIRLGIAPLYTSYIEIYDAVMEMERIVKEGLYASVDNGKDTVT